MELRHLRYLVAVADAGTFSGAADHIGVAQPALTRQLREFERELGAELFVTGARRATLTPAGEAAVQVARHVRDEIRLAVERVRLVQRGLAGRCVLWVSRGPMMAGIPARLVKMGRQRCPAITMEIVEGEFGPMWQAVADGIADIGLGQAAPRLYQSLVSETQSNLVADCAIVAADHPLASRVSVRLEELHDFPCAWVGKPSDIDQHETETYYVRGRAELLRRGFPVEQMRPMPNTDALVVAIRAQRGFSLLPGQLCSALPAGLVGLPIEDFAFPVKLARMWRRADRRPVTQTVVDLLRALERQDADARTDEAEHVEPDDATFVPPRLELRHLRSFVRVVDAGSVGRAAEELGVTQPALSRQMRDLEYDIGVPLLEREARGARPTGAGESLYKDVQDLLAAVDGMTASVLRAERGSSGHCILGAGPMPWVQDLVSHAVRHCASNYASMEVEVRDMPWARQAAALQDSVIDVGVGHGPHASRPADGIRRVVLISNPLDTALVSPRHEIASRRSARLDELATTPFVFVPRSFSSIVFDRVMTAFAERGFSPRVEATYDGLQTIWMLVAAGLGWCLAGHSQRESPPPGTVPILLQDLSIPWDVELLYRRDEARAPVLAVIDALQLRAAALREVVPPPRFELSADGTPKAAIS